MKGIFKKIIFWKIQFLAKLVLKKYKPRIITVTGSVGKTSAKEAIHAGLSSILYIGKNQKSYNSEIGIPLAILGCDSGWGGFWGSSWRWTKNILEGVVLIILPNIYPKWLVIEAGVDHPGDMDLINKWIESDVVVFTKFAETPVHVEFFDSPEDVLKEKIKLVKSLKDDGVLVLNCDDKNVLAIKEGSGKRAITFGFEEEADVRASNNKIFYENNRPAGIDFKINVNGNSLPIVLKGVLGVQHVYPILSTIAVGKALNLNIVKIVETFKNFQTAPGRMKVLDGIFGSTIIDDSYNSSPIAIEEAIKVLQLTETKGRKIAVLGDMMELGKHMKEEHKKVGALIVGKTDILVTVGKRAKFIAAEAEKSGFKRKNIHIFNNSIETGDFMKDLVKEGDIVLVKGSQSPRLEKIIVKILARPDEARWLLVRQEKEWLKK
ncbi:MAG TPA: UDP-N-acetylmuramoyl-tripeptide--D-alanyl-D-alanine ligase [Candidatus Paceibacterota bacterium]|jgi:UDP-N-acetylmuramoyl-tripeptide--D-alanyl-D-alanine ligase|nr:hypothetical protein [Parcubacteria group bacterium]MDP6119637.1 UDP-N-acetylmuramoyl-tripeptide--D-alanyl-D-alanine ligase [Candidatus Paceibacterota bacterium]MDP7320541.1 UDP-N-acetylmuramoyl-tripeptide--D-alanyl-D-alanine ligase [Bacteriovoracaceae bacterium]HJN62975.1 UDP-N-acetylmuramoyl-tripeptide--D-alanyl-D-alanine ligase [Candidatus Paceibacterota bacterium]|tara:strand:- start:547 stop:1848 length:1302 start_codon:yes stop_codon:yes gene_type:complete